MTEAVPKLWPRLGFEHFGALEYVVLQYDAEWLKHAAEQLQRAPEHAGSPGLGSRTNDYAIGACLLQLADTPAALKALNEYCDRAPRSVRALNVAVHYLARRGLDEKGTSKTSLNSVARAWGMQDASVKDAHRKYRERAAEELERLVKTCVSRSHRPRTRPEVLAALDADMRERARLPWFKLRKAQRNSRRRK